MPDRLEEIKASEAEGRIAPKDFYWLISELEASRHKVEVVVGQFNGSQAELGRAKSRIEELEAERDDG